MRNGVIGLLARFCLALLFLGVWVPLLAGFFQFGNEYFSTQAWFREDSFPENREFIPDAESARFLMYMWVIDMRAGFLVVVINSVAIAALPMSKRWLQWCAVGIGNVCALPFRWAISTTVHTNVLWKIDMVVYGFFVVTTVCFFIALQLLLRADRRWWHLWEAPSRAKQAEPADGG